MTIPEWLTPVCMDCRTELDPKRIMYTRIRRLIGTEDGELKMEVHNLCPGCWQKHVKRGV